MKIVFDTNVLIAALIAPEGVCAQLVKHCVQVHDISTSEFILDELREKLIVKFKRNRWDVEEVVALLRTQFALVEPVPLDLPVCRDLDDDIVLGTALASNAACLVTGDKDLLDLSSYQGVAIVKPSAFADYEKKLADPERSH